MSLRDRIQEHTRGVDRESGPLDLAQSFDKLTDEHALPETLETPLERMQSFASGRQQAAELAGQAAPLATAGAAAGVARP